MAEASAPASSANLGPGFDRLAVALEIRCAVKAEQAAAWTVKHTSEHRPAAGADDAVLAAARMAVGDRPLKLEVDNRIPLGRGLGSSSAAHTAGALAAWRAVGQTPTLETLFELVCELEGHPDNAAAAVFGGLVLIGGDGVPRRLPWNPLLKPVVAVPNQPFSTSDARGLLPPAYPADVVVRSVGRAASLIAGLLTADAELLTGAIGDELHEAPRNSARPDVAGLIHVARRSGAVHAAWSGAGPSVLALALDDRLENVAEGLRHQLGDNGSVVVPSVATTGAV